MTTTNATTVQTRVPRPGALPYLSVRGAREAIEFYRLVFDAELAGEPYVMGDGRIGHAELTLGGGTIYLADESPDIGFVAPTGGASAVGLMIAVDDTDSTLDRMRSAGATVIREAADNYGARGATVRDPFGHRWMLSGPVALPLATELIRDGDLGYVSWWTPDADRAARFFGHVLGWSYDTDRGPRRHLRNTSLSTGIDGGHAGSRLFCCYAVHDLDAALERVRAAGGEAQAAEEAPFGRIATCTDPQGLEFAVWQAGGQLTRPALNGVRAGDLSYVTYGAPSSATFRDFYAAVFGWTFSPGRVGDGWEPTDVAPMSGVAGGVETTWIVPMWKVDDVEAAAARVVGAGGTIIEEPARQPYGMSALCADDQGGRFYLGDA
jgi:predicted enzyme related to lactoylglutathione lyase